MVQVLSILPPEECKKLGQLPQCAILGTFDDAEWRKFSPNPAFISLLHEVIAAAADHDSMLQDAASQQRNGSVCIIDLRTPEGPQGRVPPEDIIGGFEVEDGMLKKYRANERYLPWTAHGMMQLPPSLNHALYRAILETAGAPTASQKRKSLWQSVLLKIATLARR